MSDDSTLEGFTARAQDSRLEDVWTAIPGIVLAYDAVRQVATVQVAIRRVTPNEADEYGPEDVDSVPAVPVLWPRVAGFSYHMSLPVGSSVLLVCCARDIAAWRQTAQVSSPGDLRLHSLSHAVAIPGLVPNRDVMTTPALEAAPHIGPSAGAMAVFSGATVDVKLAGHPVQPVAMAHLVAAQGTVLINALTAMQASAAAGAGAPVTGAALAALLATVITTITSLGVSASYPSATLRAE